MLADDAESVLTLALATAKVKGEVEIVIASDSLNIEEPAMIIDQWRKTRTRSQWARMATSYKMVGAMGKVICDDQGNHKVVRLIHERLVHLS